MWVNICSCGKPTHDQYQWNVWISALHYSILINSQNRNMIHFHSDECWMDILPSAGSTGQRKNRHLRTWSDFFLICTEWIGWLHRIKFIQYDHKLGLAFASRNIQEKNWKKKTIKLAINWIWSQNIHTLTW